jgi:hypothetical protein
MALRDIIQWETQSGPSRVIGDAIITPQSQVFALRTPVYGFVWNRPVSVIVERADAVTRLPIVDVTRLALFAALGFSALIYMIASTSRRRKHHE